ncbi:MAG: protein TolR [Gammaproteobacteria bacterium]|nr:protein TolR [Gammaproteobacteria bacterium]
MGEINVVPYIDVMLVLLIIFMVTAPLLTQGIKVELPKAAAEPLDQEMLSKNEPLILSIRREGTLFLNVGGDEGEALDERAVLTTAAAVLRRNPATPVLVRADTEVSYGRVVRAMALLQQAGAESVGFVTDPLPADAFEGR